MSATTIKISKATHERLLKIGKKEEDFDEIVQRLLTFYEAYSSSDIDRVHALHASLKPVAAQLVNAVRMAQHGYAKTPLELSPQLVKFIDSIAEGI